MEPGHVYVFVSPEALILIGFLLLLLFGLSLLLGAAAMDELSKPSAQEQRLLQMQVERQRAENALNQIKQDYLQRVSTHAQTQRSPKGVARNRPPASTE